MSNFFPRLSNLFSCRQKSCTRRCGNFKMSLFIRECYTVILKKSPISIISTTWKMENGKNKYRFLVRPKTINLCQNI